MVAHVEQLARSALMFHDIVFLKRPSAKPAIVHGDSSRLQQVLLNLVNNALDQIRYNRASRDTSAKDTITISTNVEKDHVLIIVEDTGGGVAPEAVNRIFEPFYTSKPTGEGTGLGLSLSFSFVRSMDGEIWVENGKQGARFVIALPLGSEASTPSDGYEETGRNSKSDTDR